MEETARQYGEQMTTIAYKDGVIAYDSRNSRGSLISNDSANKMFVAGNHMFFMSGSDCYFSDFVESFIEGKEPSKHSDTCAFVYDGNELWYAGVDECELWKQPLTYSTAIGSGAPFAIAAMDFGKDAVGAVKYAATRDIYTGGKVRSFKLK